MRRYGPPELQDIEKEVKEVLGRGMSRESEFEGIISLIKETPDMFDPTTFDKRGLKAIRTSLDKNSELRRILESRGYKVIYPVKMNETGRNRFTTQLELHKAPISFDGLEENITEHDALIIDTQQSVPSGELLDLIAGQYSRMVRAVQPYSEEMGPTNRDSNPLISHEGGYKNGVSLEHRYLSPYANSLIKDLNDCGFQTLPHDIDITERYNKEALEQLGKDKVIKRVLEVTNARGKSFSDIDYEVSGDSPLTMGAVLKGIGIDGVLPSDVKSAEDNMEPENSKDDKLPND